MGVKMENGKGISLFFRDGRYDSLMRVTGTNWRGGLIYVVPRTEINKLLEVEEAKRFGVYILLSDNQIYAGEASDLKTRIKQHDKSKNWWERAVLITTTDNSFDQADINYLESSIIGFARKQKNLKCENKQVGNKIKLDDMKKASLDSFLKEALEIMKVLGVLKIESKASLDDKDNDIGRLKHGNGGRYVALRFLKEKGFPFKDGFVYNYSAKQKETEKSTYKNECWINPKSKNLNLNWYLILNDTDNRLLHVFFIPPGTFKLKTETEGGFLKRHDNPNLIDLHIDLSTFIERKSGINISNYKMASYNY